MARALKYALALPISSPIATRLGTTTSTSEYRTFDLDPYSGLSYYRLKQVDHNGAFEYSPLAAVIIGAESNLHVWMNGNTLQIAHDALGEPFRILDMSGRLVREGRLTREELESVELESLSPGLYSITIGSDGVLFTKRFYR